MFGGSWRVEVRQAVVVAASIVIGLMLLRRALRLGGSDVVPDANRPLMMVMGRNSHHQHQQVDEQQHPCYATSFLLHLPFSF
jgi:hypothetical protein